MELIKTVRVIGSFVLAIIIVAIPFLCGLSFGLKFASYLQLILTILTIGLVAIVAMLIYAESEE